ncbi:MAG: hypothetical protein OXO52_07630 [Rhodospirillales bacterium]|nr:hypothetical protein [Rhodospirillales bacterium]
MYEKPLYINGQAGAAFERREQDMCYRADPAGREPDSAVATGFAAERSGASPGAGVVAIHDSVFIACFGVESVRPIGRTRKITRIGASDR